MFKFALWVAFFVVGLTCSAAAADSEQVAWAKLQRGMSQAEVERIVGVPLLRNAARGHELWIYDGGASLQFHGRALSAWTAPGATSPAAPRVTAKAPAPRIAATVALAAR